MSNNKTPFKPMTLIIIIVVIFVAALVVSILIQLFNSPDFSGFKKAPAPTPVVTFIPGGDASTADTSTPVYNWQDHPVFIVGDSLTQGAKNEINKVVANATIDAQQSRGMGAGLQVIQNWDATGKLPDDAIIVVCLANNITDTTVQDAQKIVDMIKPGQSLIMMTGHGLSNMADANAFIRSLPNLYPYVTLADWDLTIAQSPSLLGADGIHISKSQGNTLYADLIVRALEVTQPRPQS